LFGIWQALESSLTGLRYGAARCPSIGESGWPTRRIRQSCTSERVNSDQLLVAAGRLTANTKPH